jgi:beta-phosphoglucomutase
MTRDATAKAPSPSENPQAGKFCMPEGLCGRAALFDLNGTLTDDEGLIFQIFVDILEPVGVTLEREPYFRDLVGLDDLTIIRRSLASAGLSGDEHFERGLLRARIDCYRERFQRAHPVRQGAVDLLVSLASRVPVGLVSAACRQDIDIALDGLPVRGLLRAVVRLEDVARAKPDPECYRLGLEHLRRSSGMRDLDAREVIVFEDSAAGVAAAKGAGMNCVAVLGTQPAGELAQADLIVEELTPELLEPGHVRPAA